MAGEGPPLERIPRSFRRRPDRQGGLGRALPDGRASDGVRSSGVSKAILIPAGFETNRRVPGSTLPGKDPGMAEPPGDPLLAGLAAGREEAFAALYARDGAALFRVAFALLGSPGRRRGRGAGGVRRPGPGAGRAGGGRQPAGVPVHRPAPRRGEGGRPPPGRPPRTAARRPRRPGPPRTCRPGRRRGWSGRWRRCRPTGARSSP